MEKPKKTRKSEKPAFDVEAYGEQADKSARHFIATLGTAILDLPNIKKATQEEADKAGYKLLDELYAAFISAQTDAIKFAVADICKGLGMEKAIYPLAN